MEWFLVCPSLGTPMTVEPDIEDIMGRFSDEIAPRHSQRPRL